MFGFGKKPNKISAAAAADPIAKEQAPAKNLFARLFDGLKKSSSKIAEGLGAVLTKRKLDQATLDELEDLLISADLGAPAARRVIAAVKAERFDKEATSDEIKQSLAAAIAAILAPRAAPLRALAADPPPNAPRVVLFVGVNGSGKTTTIGKIASHAAKDGRQTVLAAGDTFRAAAIEQLQVWGARAGFPVIARAPGADPAGLAFEALETAQKTDASLVLIDTAGRLQNKTQLMDELAKIIRALRKLDPAAPHDVVLVLDATVGQNALSQLAAFSETAGVTGLVMTKLDGTAKGGVLVAIADAHTTPIHYIGIGESAEDLQVFDAQAFARALVGLDES